MLFSCTCRTHCFQRSALRSSSYMYQSKSICDSTCTDYYLQLVGLHGHCCHLQDGLHFRFLHRHGGTFHASSVPNLFCSVRSLVALWLLGWLVCYWTLGYWPRMRSSSVLGA